MELLREILDWGTGRPVVILDACGPPGVKLGPLRIGGVEARLVASGYESLNPFPNYPEGPAEPRRALRGAVASAGLGAPCLDQLPGGNRPALSYLVLGALQGWGDRGGVIQGSEVLELVRDVSLDVVAREREALPLPLGFSRP
ncbi:MAG: hypothetical protein KC420_19305, partial [Myxococcales bacterium]|nr:hypothetical protein [Myxococcales bacterium]